MNALVVWRYAWAAPATLVGLLVAAAAIARGAQARVVDGVIEVAAGGPDHRARPPHERGRFCAITLGHVVVGTDSGVLARVRRHEHVHVRQYERWGVLFFPLYAGASVAAWLQAKDPYWDNRFEREARREAGDEPRTMV